MEQNINVVIHSVLPGAADHMDTRHDNTLLISSHHKVNKNTFKKVNWNSIAMKDKFSILLQDIPWNSTVKLR